jgi:peroxiredoxin
MAEQSKMVALGSQAPDFALPDVASGRTVTLEEFADSPAVLVAFLCNHCPYVKHVLDSFVSFAREYVPRGLAVVTISANDAETYPEDAPPEMARLAKARRFPFPYLYDESQAIAVAYGAVCTPDFFLFDRARQLAYRGQFDSSRPRSATPVTGADLRAAADAVLQGHAPSTEQLASVGCGVKWRK